MQRWARIQNSKVAEIIDFDPTGRYHPALFWVEIPEPENSEQIACGWTWTEQDGFSPPDPPAPPTPEELGNSFDAAITRRLDVFARKSPTPGLPWNNIIEAMQGAKTEDFKEEGDIAVKAWNDTWLAADALLPQVLSGELSVRGAVERLPVLEWPVDG
jgi:hypothetical protein